MAGLSDRELKLLHKDNQDALVRMRVALDADGGSNPCVEKHRDLLTPFVSGFDRVFFLFETLLQNGNTTARRRVKLPGFEFVGFELRDILLVIMAATMAWYVITDSRASHRAPQPPAPVSVSVSR